jgi:purine operon repressor
VIHQILCHKHNPFTSFISHYFQPFYPISEDVQIIKSTFQKEALGTVITTAGASGGVTYKPNNLNIFAD